MSAAQLQSFQPLPPLLETKAHPDCRATVIMPARNEEHSLRAALDALAGQVDLLSGRLLPPSLFEVVLLLNNCTDASASAAYAWQRQYPSVALHIVERELAPEHAHVGMARRLLMDTAWQRMSRQSGRICGILSTDADTRVAPDWIARNLHALEQGAHAVGGMIWLAEEELAALPPGARHAYRCDREYEALVAALEDLLDPQSGDPSPRHLQHFGASLACTPQAYMEAGGLPVRRALEDVAFVDALRRVNARLRHDPAVHVHTSARLRGRVEVGLSAQLGVWQQMHKDGTPHTVPSCAWLVHRFRTLRSLRLFHRRPSSAALALFPITWRPRLARTQPLHRSPAAFLAELDCDALIAETFSGPREEVISSAMAHLSAAILGERARSGHLLLKEAPRGEAVPEPVSRGRFSDRAAS